MYTQSCVSGLMTRMGCRTPGDFKTIFFPPRAEFSLAAQMPLINSAFAAATVEEIQERLVSAAGSSSVAARSLEALQRASPTSLKLALRQIRTGATLPTLAACLNMEYRYRHLHLPPSGLHPQISLVYFLPQLRKLAFSKILFFKGRTVLLGLYFS
jgi:hypothetical protein